MASLALVFVLLLLLLLLQLLLLLTLMRSHEKVVCLKGRRRDMWDLFNGPTLSSILFLNDAVAWQKTIKNCLRNEKKI
jgi:hypothetical protein